MTTGTPSGSFRIYSIVVWEPRQPQSGQRGLPLLFNGAPTMLTVPDKQMEDFMRVLNASLTEGGLVNEPLALGERVRVTRGPLKGVEGNVLELQGAYYVVVGLSSLVYAKARIPRAWLEKVKQ